MLQRRVIADLGEAAGVLPAPAARRSRASRAGPWARAPGWRRTNTSRRTPSRGRSPSPCRRGENSTWLRTVTQTCGCAAPRWTAPRQRERQGAEPHPLRPSAAISRSAVAPNGGSRPKNDGAGFSIPLQSNRNLKGWRVAFGQLRSSGPRCSLLSGCGLLQRAERPAWRAQAEKACFAEGRVKPSAALRELAAIDGPGICGMEQPLRVTALKDGAHPARQGRSSMDCPMVAALEDWLDQVVQPAAMARFGVAVTRTRRVRRLFLPHGRQPRRAETLRTRVRQRRRRFRLQPRGRAQNRRRARLEADRQPGIGVPARGAGRRLRRVHHGARAGLRRVPLQSLPPRSGDARPHQHRAAPLLPTDARASSAAAARTPDGLPPAPEIDEPMDVASARAAPRRRASPRRRSTCTGRISHSPRRSARRRPLVAPVLPPEDSRRTAPPTSGSQRLAGDD